jgi:hypothetical protein
VEWDSHGCHLSPGRSERLMYPHLLPVIY